MIGLVPFICSTTKHTKYTKGLIFSDLGSQNNSFNRCLGIVFEVEMQPPEWHTLRLYRLSFSLFVYFVYFVCCVVK